MTDRFSLALEGAWRDIQTRHPDVPNVVMLAGMADRGGCGGWCGVTAEGVLIVNIARSRLRGGLPQRVLTTMLHEAAHAVMWATRGTMGDQWGGYHHWTFATAAERLGLVAPMEPDPELGFSQCTIDQARRHQYASTIARLARAL
jgi:hypothetical protein